MRTGAAQERSVSPSTCTVQAPHWAMPQPYLVPVRPRSSRRTQSSGVAGSTSTSRLWPLTLSEMGILRNSERCSRVQRGQAEPVSIQAAISAPNCSCVPGAGSRVPPGRQAQPTRVSCVMCSWICARVLPPFRRGSLTCSQICWSERCCQAMPSGATCHSGWPGTPAGSKFASWWQVVQRMPIAPLSSAPRTTSGLCGCMSAPWVGRSPTGWQFRQRGCWITLPASANKARDRSARSATVAKLPAGRRSAAHAAPPRTAARKSVDTDLPVRSFIVPFLRAARVFGPARMGRTLASGDPERQCASSPRLHGPGSAFVAVPRTMILKSFVALTCLLATAMTIAQSSPSVPVAPREPKDVTVHGDRRIDDYFWLRQRDDPRTLPYLRAENAYADVWFAPHAALKEKLYQEMFGRIQQDDDSVPYRKGLWWYSSRTQKGEQYPRYIRRRALGADRSYDPQGKDETLLDLNEMARGQAFLRLGLAAVTLDAGTLAYTLDLTGGRDFTLRIRDLATGKDDAWSMPQVSSAAWANDGRTLYYVTMDQSKRSSKLWRHVVAAAGRDTLVLEEKDELFDLGIGKTRDDRFLVLTSESKDASEQSVLDADAPSDTATFRVVFPRRPDIEYDLDHRAGSLYVLINDTGRNFRLVKVDAARPDLGRAEELIAAHDRVMLDDFDVFA